MKAVLEPSTSVNIGPGEEGTPLYGLYGDMPLDGVWFSSSLA